MHEGMLQNVTFQEKIHQYWYQFESPEVSNLITTYDIKEIQEKGLKLPDHFYQQFEQFCNKAYQAKQITAEYTHYLINICEKLPTVIMMYFMQTLSVENKTLFQKIFDKLKSEPKYHQLHNRCECFEKNILLYRVCTSERLSLINHLIEEVLREE